jgi:hypothetical protein
LPSGNLLVIGVTSHAVVALGDDHDEQAQEHNSDEQGREVVTTGTAIPATTPRNKMIEPAHPPALFSSAAPSRSVLRQNVIARIVEATACAPQAAHIAKSTLRRPQDAAACDRPLHHEDYLNWWFCTFPSFGRRYRDWLVLGRRGRGAN